ncbi:MAG: bifunctional 5,10-methylenetetrahydrofolate dehydrogenase/5,10-methenyltetrahydrofolate cyclohydrolase [Candidatus Omnitrophica bacterium]|nr:bifunctional 5,10-methylenetetrahydrofolate dehydrogenase/5,10-methenyltetrahydrofolate cyclohydrolase [Candidatus Omnitrophota bacterium]
MAEILDGKLLASKIKEELKAEVASLKKKTGKTPRIVVVSIGEDSSAGSYSKSQRNSAEAIGIEYETKVLPALCSQGDLENAIRILRGDENVSGIMIHKPVPKSINYNAAYENIGFLKDAEGMSPENLGKMLLQETKLIPCTPQAVVEVLKSVPGYDLKGKEAVIVGRSDIVGKPLSLLLLKENMTVTVCHSHTSSAGKLDYHIAGADVLVAAIGKPNFVRGNQIKKGAVVIDVGINFVNEKLVGDVDFEGAKNNASYITPVPGGIGPVTVVMLMKNTIEAFKLQNRVT